MTNQSNNQFDARSFRRALGNFATGVTVITAQNNAGEKVGVTANSFNSVSIDPPLVLWSIDKSAHSYQVFNTATHFAVNILAADQIDLSNRFARKGEDKFSGVEWDEGAGKAPIIRDCSATFQCKNYQQVDAGDHWILIGEVVEFDDAGRSPLCFHQGSYSMVVGHPGAVKPSDSAQSTTANRGRLNENIYYLLFQAVRAYQSSYLPKQQALGLNSGEARCLFIISDRPGVDIEELNQISDIPQHEITEAVSNLTTRGLVKASGNAYELTPQGAEKAEAYWLLANEHAQSVMENLDEQEIANFKQALRKIGGSF